MTYKYIHIILGFLVLTGCGGSLPHNKVQVIAPFNFVEPIKTEIYEESEKGGNKESFMEEAEFMPHPLIPLKEISNNDKKSVPNNLFYTGATQELGVDFDQPANKKINPGTMNVSDPMLESIRQDLMLKWGIEEPVIRELNSSSKTIADIETKIKKFENSMKGDLAALRSENLMLVSRLQDLEKQMKTGKSSVIKQKKQQIVKKVNKPSPKTKSVKSPKRSKASYKDRYDFALTQYRQRKFDSAIKKFKSLTDEDNNHSLSDNAQYWIGECYYHLGFYNKAASEFQKVLAFDNSNKKDSAILMRGKALKHLGLNKDAIEQFRSLIAQYPRSSYTKRARELISTLEKG